MNQKRSVAIQRLFAAMSGAIFLGGFTGMGVAQEPNVAWTEGPDTVKLGENIAELALSADHIFAGGDDTRKLMEMMGNSVSGQEVGIVSPKAENQDWFMIFEYAPEGYVKDDDKDAIDKDAILKSYQEGTEEANKTRKEKGISGLHVVGWYEEPHYDERTHNLVWAILAKDDGGGQVVNYNVRLLGREGYMSATLVDDPSRLATSKGEIDRIISAFSYKQGKRYAEWLPGDKVAKYGLAALVAGGAGAAAVKLGFFAAFLKFAAKAWKLLVVAALAIVAAIKKGISALRGRGAEA
ncbi:MAG: DUF2167 domain-containing protein [Acidobacteria bacterium]|nr:DUF2167 domain-containing protein [Acidobacteriota bacterium]